MVQIDEFIEYADNLIYCDFCRILRLLQWNF